MRVSEAQSRELPKKCAIAGLEIKRSERDQEKEEKCTQEEKLHLRTAYHFSRLRALELDLEPLPAGHGVAVHELHRTTGGFDVAVRNKSVAAGSALGVTHDPDGFLAGIFFLISAYAHCRRQLFVQTNETNESLPAKIPYDVLLRHEHSFQILVHPIVGDVEDEQVAAALR